jgi:hypothetical protein
MIVCFSAYLPQSVILDKNLSLLAELTHLYETQLAQKNIAVEQRSHYK